jgi:hypothetical protein
MWGGGVYECLTNASRTENTSDVDGFTKPQTEVLETVESEI